MMSIQLPRAIELYIKAENSAETEGLAEYFAPDAVVYDEKRAHKGLTAIGEWRAETKKKYNHKIQPLEIADRDGKAVLVAKVTGTFPGSPVQLRFTFTIKDGKIASLEIH